ncbi:MAG: hypothetical protein PHF97_09885 [Bacteroidales bacterium]|nr:hypothetical protein [Bacteroidales bacterium]
MKIINQGKRKKNNIITLVFIISSLFIGCKKSDTTNPSSNIVFEQINKTIVFPSADTISGACRKLIFELPVNPPNSGKAILKENGGIMQCDGFNSFLVDAQNTNVIVLNENVLVPSDGNWHETNTGLILNNFEGRGRKFIGYRAYYYPDGVLSFRYGWIKIELSPNRDTLKVISRATNLSYNQPILTGQTK